MPKAAREAVDILSRHFPAIKEFALIPSTGGVFEVKVGDELVFSKKALDRFPEEEELEQIVASKLE